MKLQPAEPGYVALPTRHRSRFSDHSDDQDTLDPHRTIALGCAHDYTEGGDEHLRTYQMRQEVHAWLSAQGFRYLIWADIFAGAMDLNEYETVPWNYADYSIEFPNPDEAMFFRFRWGGVA